MARRPRLRGLIPVALYRSELGEMVVGWGSPTQPIKETPMFGWATRNAEEEVTTDLGMLVEYAENFDESKFAGAILHVSRCGSTALANAFKAVPHTLVLSEPDVFSQLIRETRCGGAAVRNDQRRTLVNGFLAAVLKEHPASSIVVKCSSVSTISLDETLRYMPSVPWCFVSRSPADVIASLERTPGMWLRTQETRERVLRRIGRQSSHTADEDRSRDLYAFLLERFYLSAMAHADENAMFLDYADFSLDSVCSVVEALLKQPIDRDTRDAIAKSLQFYSKAVVPTPFVAAKPQDVATGYPDLDAAYGRYRAFIAASRPRSDHIAI
jgi:hypothetical protein